MTQTQMIARAHQMVNQAASPYRRGWLQHINVLWRVMLSGARVEDMGRQRHWMNRCGVA